MIETINKNNWAVKQLMLRSAQEANILPLTSACNVKCLFCSHQQNPPEVKAYRIPPRELEEIEETLDFLNPTKKVVIGESVTKINEGEPFTHPKIKDILVMIRRRFPATTIQITSNGTKLNEEMISFLSELGKIELNLSLNSCSLENRETLMKDNLAGTAIASVELLKRYQVDFHGSIVAVPFIYGWSDLEESIKYFDRHGAKTIRVFLPGFTRLAPEELKFGPDLWGKIAAVVTKMQQQLATPITLEPKKISNFEAEVEGVIVDSPASRAGIKSGDLIIGVNDQEVYSRVDAFQQIYKAKNPKLEFLRSRKKFLTQINKAPGDSSGLVMSFDLNPKTPEAILQTIQKNRAQKTFVLTSHLALPLIKAGIERALTETEEAVIKVEEVTSQFFGGTIMAAGLLVVEDFLRHLEKTKLENYQLILLPAIAFDPWGKDLTGRSYHEIEEKTGVRVEII